MSNIFTQIFQRFRARQKLSREQRRDEYATQFCRCGDWHGTPCIEIGGVPLFRITSEPTDSVRGKVNVNEVSAFIAQIKDCYMKHNDW